MAERADPARNEPAPASTVAEDGTVPLRAEELSAVKRLEQSGEVEIRKEVVVENRTIEVPVAREQLVVERRAVSGAPEQDAEASRADVVAKLAAGETMTIPLAEEEVVVQKRPVVTQEAVIGKRLVDSIKRVSEVVRREEPVIETSGSVTVERSPGLERSAGKQSTWTNPLVVGWSVAGIGVGLAAGWLRRRWRRGRRGWLARFR